MNTKKRLVLILVLTLLVGPALETVNWSAPRLAPVAGGAPNVVAYQGEIQVDGSPFTGNGYLKFAIVNAGGNTSYWSNDGTSSGGGQPNAAVQLPVSDGLFAVLLGDTSLGGMTEPLTPEAFGGPERYLRVWFGTSGGGPFSLLGPDTRVASVPYALQAAQVAGYPNLVTVAKSGADFASIQDAIDSIDDATASNPYLVWVAPGVYQEQVTTKPHVHLQGAGQDVTTIASTVTSGDWPPTQGTLHVDTFVSVRDLTVQSGGVGDNNAAIVVLEGAIDTTLADVAVYAGGPAKNNLAVVVAGSNTIVSLQHVTAFAAWANNANVGLMASGGARVTLHGGSFRAEQGERAWAVFAVESGTVLEAVDVSMRAESANLNNTAMYPFDGAKVVLRGGHYTARRGEQTNAIADQLNSRVEAYDVTALAEDGDTNYGLGPFDGSSMIVRGATVIARGGTTNYAVDSESKAMLDAESIISVAENGSGQNYGLYVSGDGAGATVRGGSYTARGGTEARGISIQLGGAWLDAEGVTALGENASSTNFGLDNTDEAAVTLRGGFFTGRGGTQAYGLSNAGSGSMLDADSVTALGEDGSSNNRGLYNLDSARATLRGGSFIGRGEGEAFGISDAYSNTVLNAYGVTALGESSGGDGTGLSIDSVNGSIVLRGGSFTGRGWYNSIGIDFDGMDSTLAAGGITVLGEEGQDSNHGLMFRNTGTMTVDSSQFAGSSAAVYQLDGDLYLGVSQLDGGAAWSGGTVTCFQVYDENYMAVTCP